MISSTVRNQSSGLVSAEWGLLSVTGAVWSAAPVEAEANLLDRSLSGIYAGIWSGPVRVSMQLSSSRQPTPDTAAVCEVSVEASGSELVVSDPGSITENIVALPIPPGSFRALFALTNRSEFCDQTVFQPETSVKITLWPEPASATQVIRDDGFRSGANVTRTELPPAQSFEIPVVLTADGPRPFEPPTPPRRVRAEVISDDPEGKQHL